MTYEYSFQVPENVQKYFYNKEIKVTSDLPLRKSQGGNVYNASIITVKGALTQAIYEQTDGYKEDELHCYRENEAIKNVERIHVAGHIGILAMELHSEKLDWVSEICVANNYQSSMKKGDWIG